MRDVDVQFEEWARAMREDSIAKMLDSAFIMQLAPPETVTDADDIDVVFALQIGASVLMDKPVVVVVMPGRQPPERLLRLADAVIELDNDLDTEAGQLELQRRLGDAGLIDV